MARRIRGQLLDGLLQTMGPPTVGLDRGGAVRFYSDSFKQFYPDLKETKTLWDQLSPDPFVRWISDCLDSTDPAVREQIMGHFPGSLWMARLEPIFGEAGRCAGFIVSMSDVAPPAEPISERLDTLLQEVRVGLGRPLSQMKCRLEVLLEGAYQDPDVTVELLQQLNEDSNELARLLFSLETPEQSEAPDLPDDTSTSLRHIAEAVHQTFEPLARSKNLALKLDLGRAGSKELASVSEDELKMCLTNLIDNAIKYTALNGYGEVQLSLSTDAEGVTFKVDDSGPGIPKAAREAVFEQFYRMTEGPTTKLGGTGLGLWRVKEKTRQRNGRVWIEDSPKGGAGLRLFFPHS